LTSDAIPFRVAVRTWFAISLQTFGGPAGQIALMQRVLVEDKRWIGQRRFLHALNYCMLLPGPEAQQLATYSGWLLNGVAGGLIAGTLFVLPGVVVMLGLSAIYVGLGETAVVTGLFLGLAPAVVAIVLQALIRVSRRSLIHLSQVGLAVGAFLALTVFAVPFPAVVVVAGLLGWLVFHLKPSWMAQQGSTTAEEAFPPVIGDDRLHADRPSRRRNMTILAIGLVGWAAPIVAAALLLGPGSVVVEQGLFFSGTALISFGGAYAALAYVAQQAVNAYGWLKPDEMIQGLALAETTPGPLIMVVQFVAFVGAFRSPGSLDPWLAATLGALITTWVTFVPGFLFVLLGAPSVEKLRGNERLSAALTGIAAAVVGVIASLALYFAMHTFFTATAELHWGPVHLLLPQLSAIAWPAVLIAALASVLIFLLRWPIPAVLGVCAVIGAVVQLLSR
jgi:chromate transporter